MLGLKKVDCHGLEESEWNCVVYAVKILYVRQSVSKAEMITPVCSARHCIETVRQSQKRLQGMAVFKTHALLISAITELKISWDNAAACIWNPDRQTPLEQPRPPGGRCLESSLSWKQRCLSRPKTVTPG